jgi:hypothetical protein
MGSTVRTSSAGLSLHLPATALRQGLLLAVVLLPSVACGVVFFPGSSFLETWPSARSAALGGATTALGDDADAGYWNPGALGFKRSLGLIGSYGDYEGSFAPPDYSAYAGMCYPLPRSPLHLGNVTIGANAIYQSNGRGPLLDTGNVTNGISGT